MPLATLALVLSALVQAPSEPRVELDVPYGTAAEVELTLDAYLPPGGGPHPALLLVHGGAWMHGDKRDMRAFGERLARAGYACFAPRYRLAPAHRFPAQLEDCRYALQFVRTQAARFRVDPARFGALGPSAGGHLAALLGTLDEARDPAAADPVLRESSRVQCVVNYFGPVILTREPELDFDTQPPPEVFGDSPDSAYEAASPLRFVDAGDASFLIVHGDADRIVPVGHAHVMEEALRAARVPCELLVVPGGGHGDFFLTDPDGEHWRRTERFLAKHLRATAVPASAR